MERKDTAVSTPKTQVDRSGVKKSYGEKIIPPVRIYAGLLSWEEGSPLGRFVENLEKIATIPLDRIQTFINRGRNRISHR